MVVLGIDPGFARMGWGIIQKQTANQIKLIKYGCIETKASTPTAQRLQQIFAHTIKIAQKYKPHSAAIEDLFFNTNAKTAIKVGEARGAILIALIKQKLPLHHYTPLQVKNAITGYGRADKTQIQKMVKTLLKLDHIPKPDDAADALAVALTHCFTVKNPKSTIKKQKWFLFLKVKLFTSLQPASPCLLLVLAT